MIELSFVTVVVAFVGQALARRAFKEEVARGVTLAEMSMRSSTKIQRRNETRRMGNERALLEANALSVSLAAQEKAYALALP